MNTEKVGEIEYYVYDNPSKTVKKNEITDPDVLFGVIKDLLYTIHCMSSTRLHITTMSSEGIFDEYPRDLTRNSVTSDSSEDHLYMGLFD
jgi:hypothetical protein